MGNKVALFDDDVSNLYDFVIDMKFSKARCAMYSDDSKKDLSDGGNPLS
jgi:hypothetical protein